jgi:hypothetical protein
MMTHTRAMTACAVSLCLLLGACEREVELGRGYQLVDVDTRPTSVITDPDNHMVVDPHVSRYEVIDPYILGERQDADLDPELSRKFGYFILNMQTGQLQEGLDREAFESALEAADIDPSILK